MVIAICILGGLLFFAIITIFALWYALNVVLNDYIEKKSSRGYFVLFRPRGRKAISMYSFINN